MLDTDRVFSLEIQAEHIHIMFRSLARGIVLNIITAHVFILALWNTASHRALLAWLSVVYGSMIIRWLFVRAYQRRQPLHEEVARWGLVSAVQSGISGLVWGVTPVLFLDPAQPVSLIVISIFLIGVMGSAIGSFQLIDRLISVL